MTVSSSLGRKCVAKVDYGDFAFYFERTGVFNLTIFLELITCFNYLFYTFIIRRGLKVSKHKISLNAKYSIIIITLLFTFWMREVIQIYWKNK